ncbi:MAG: hypothetical protein AAFN50_11950, partial [Pseudomonadota bacterium]
MNFKIWIVLAALGLPGIALSQANDSILNDSYIISEEFVEGQVTQVRPRAGTITIRGANRGDQRQFAIPENARVTVNGREARLRDIRRGDTVSVSIVRRGQRVIVDQLRVPQSDATLEERRENPIVATASLPTTLPKTASNQMLWQFSGLALLLA